MSDRQSLLLTVRTLTRVLDAADPFTRGRSLRVAAYALRVARELGANPTELEDIELGALLHDLGRTAALSDVVTAPRALDAGERALVNTHPQLGWEMLHAIPGMERAAEIVLAHHERPDGRGYPRALTGDAIPLGSRLIMVAAAYDAMTEDRPYRRGLAPAMACEELRRHSGTQFFPEVVDAFVALHDNGRLWDDFPAEERPETTRDSAAA